MCLVFAVTLLTVKMSNSIINIATGETCTVLLNQHPKGRYEVQGIVAKINHATILVKLPDGQFISRKIRRDYVGP